MEQIGKIGKDPGLHDFEVKRGKDLVDYIEKQIGEGNFAGGLAFMYFNQENKINSGKKATICYVNERKENFTIEIDPSFFENNYGEGSFSELQMRFGSTDVELVPDSMVSEKIKNMFKENKVAY